MDKEIKIGFHSAVSEPSKYYYLTFLSSKGFHPVVSGDYDYYIANEAIYWNHGYMRELLDSDSSAIRIMGCGEAIFPDLNLFDYAIWHCGHYMADDRIIYDPLIRSEVGYLIDAIHDIDKSKTPGLVNSILSEKTKFCNFIYSNPRAHPMRDSLFYKISEYRQVDSLGSHLNNINIQDTRFADGWERISIELKKPYKFSIAAENASFPGYTSEKIMSSMLANTIPIYWGDPFVGDWFNSKSFININNYDNLDDALEVIKEIDRNDDAYIEMMCQPWRTKEQIQACDNAINDYEKSLINIFLQDKKDAVRRPRGTWPDMLYPVVFKKEKKGKTKEIIKGIYKCLSGGR